MKVYIVQVKEEWETYAEVVGVYAHYETALLNASVLHNSRCGHYEVREFEVDADDDSHVIKNGAIEKKILDINDLLPCKYKDRMIKCNEQIVIEQQNREQREIDKVANFVVDLVAKYKILNEPYDTRLKEKDIYYIDKFDCLRTIQENNIKFREELQEICRDKRVCNMEPIEKYVDTLRALDLNLLDLNELNSSQVSNESW
jgi:hypothetical protein